MQALEALPIRSRCLPLAMALAMLALLAQPALAQDTLGSVDLTSSPGARDVQPGGKAIFRIQALNKHILEQNVAFVALPPAGWTFNFTPANLTLPSGASGNVTLEVFAPADARVNETLALPVEARPAAGSELRLGRISVNLTVVAPPPAQDGGSNGGGQPVTPALEITAGGSSGAPGQTVEGLLTLRNGGSSTLDVTLAGSGPIGWNPRFLGGDDLQVIYPGEAPRVVRVYASIPIDAQPDTQHALTLTASVGPHRFPATWRVSVVPPPAGSGTAADGADDAPDAATTTSGATTGGQGDAAVPTVGPAAAPALDLRLVEPLLQVAPGESARGTLRLENTGTTALKLRLVGSGPTDWPAPVFDLATLDLLPGASAQVGFTLTAPRDVIPSTTGRGAGTLMATAEGGLVRTARYEVMVVPAAPIDASQRDTETNAATLQAPEGSNVPLGTFGLAAAFGAVGAGALALANRPMREKLVWAAVGLYTRLARPDVLGHEDREKLYKLVEQTPGIHFHALQRDLAWNTGTLTYHLRVLEKHGFVVSRRDGLYRRFYLQGSAPRKEVFENQGPQGLRADVLEAIRNRHGMSQSDLALALGANKQTVNYHVKALERQGLIRLEKKGRETFLYPADAPATGGQREASA